MDKRVKVMVKEDHANQNMIHYHIKKPISKKNRVSFHLPETASSIKLSNMGEIGEAIVKGLNEVEGIVIIHINPYEVTIIKSPIYEWDEIHPKVWKVLEGVLEEGIETQFWMQL